MGKKHFRKHWEKFLAMPKENLHIFCGALYFFIKNEEAIKNNSHFNMSIDKNKMFFGDKRTITCTKDLQKATLLGCVDARSRNYFKPYKNATYNDTA